VVVVSVAEEGGFLFPLELERRLFFLDGFESESELLEESESELDDELGDEESDAWSPSASEHSSPPVGREW